MSAPDAMQSSATPAELAAAAKSGVIATFMAVTVGYSAPGLGLTRLDLPLLNGNLIVPPTTAVSFSWTIGLLHTAGLGALLAVMYVAWVRDHLPGSALVRGGIWGAVVGAVSGLTVFPLLYGAGVFGLAWDPTMPIIIAIWHLVWGLALGVMERLVPLRSGQHPG